MFASNANFPTRDFRCINTMLTESQLIESLKPEYWLALNPGLSITDDLLSRSPGTPYPVENIDADRHMCQFHDDGYFSAPDIFSREEATKLANGIVNTTLAGFPATFCLIYDEYWQPLRRLDHLLEPIMGKGYKLLPDFWFYHIRNDDKVLFSFFNFRF